MKFEQLKIAVSTAVSAGAEGDHLNVDLLVRSELHDLVELSLHYRRPTDLAMQNRLVQQGTVTRRSFLFEKLLALESSFRPLAENIWVEQETPPRYRALLDKAV